MPRDSNYQYEPVEQKRGADWVDPRPARTMARILELLKDGPLTRLEISEKLSLSQSTAHHNLTRLQAEPRKIHVCGWVRTSGNPHRQFALGDKPDVPFVPLHQVVKPEVDTVAVACKRIVSALVRHQSVQELATSLGCSVAYVRKYIAILLAESPRRIYVKTWRRPTGPGGLTKVYAIGNKPDAQPPRLTGADRFKELKANPEKHERFNKVRCLAAARRRTRKKPQTIFSALGL